MSKMIILNIVVASIINEKIINYILKSKNKKYTLL